MMQSFGLAFLFIPINVSAFSFVPKEKTNMGTGINQPGSQYRAAWGFCYGDDALAAAHPVSSSAVDGARECLEPGIPVNKLHAIPSRLHLAVQSGPGAAAQAHGMIYATVTAAGRNAGVRRQLFTCWGLFSSL